jgi:hypothetical protein
VAVGGGEVGRGQFLGETTSVCASDVRFVSIRRAERLGRSLAKGLSRHRKENRIGSKRELPKSRAGNAQPMPEEALRREKRRNLSHMARQFPRMPRLEPVSHRFDTLTIADVRWKNARMHGQRGLGASKD